MQSGSIRLADGGARLAEKLAALHRDIQKQEQLVMSKHSNSTLPQFAGHLSSAKLLLDSRQSGQDRLPRHHTDTRQLGRQDRRGDSDKGQDGTQQLAQRAEGDSCSSQQAGRGPIENNQRGGRSGPERGRGRGLGRGRQSSPDLNRYTTLLQQLGTAVRLVE